MRRFPLFLQPITDPDFIHASHYNTAQARACPNTSEKDSVQNRDRSNQ
jgi:hypothetical protein